jgi:pimeloyl-ACP methyl ester carboxylesterase
MFHVDVPDAPEEFPVRYDIQLPPEYDPYVRYPAIVTLHAAGGTPESQVTWWAGAADAKSGERRGQAARHGYIVIAPAWTTSRQKAYEYSAREHHVVLASLRDAMRRFSIDSDRVFLSGHALGGDAAWDIGLAHPDLWAGLMVVGARADYGRDDSPLYVTLYNDNAKAFPLYFVFGELDSNKFADNRVPLNRYMKQSGFDPIVVQYQGRGNEHFYEEIQRLFQWMGPQRRDFFPESLEAATMRPWDNYFWYLEVDGLPDAALVSPLSWPPRRARPAKLEARYANNRVVVDAGVSRVTVWLAPRMVDFTRPVELEIINGRDARLEVTPDLETMLEDARTRSDRQHVFWAKVEQQTGRGGR